MFDVCVESLRASIMTSCKPVESLPVERKMEKECEVGVSRDDGLKRAECAPFVAALPLIGCMQCNPAIDAAAQGTNNQI